MSFIAFVVLLFMSIGTTHFVVILFERVRLGGQMSTLNKLVSLDFEVFGKVQGKYFHWTCNLLFIVASWYLPFT